MTQKCAVTYEQFKEGMKVCKGCMFYNICLQAAESKEE